MWLGYLAIGDEIIGGRRVNTNSAMVSRTFFEHGMPLEMHLAVGDDSKKMLQLLASLENRSGLLIVTGGLGPTRDDITREVFAKWANVPLVKSMQAEKWLRALLAQRGREWGAGCDIQTLLPQGAKALYNPVGSACGFVLKKGRLKVAIFPGVPKEFESMLSLFFDAYIGKNKIAPMYRSVWTVGWPEALQVGVSAFEKLPKGMIFSSLPSEQGVQISLMDFSSASAERKNLFASTWKALVKAIPSDVLVKPFGLTARDAVTQYLHHNKQTLSIAESLTAGYTGYLITQTPGSSKIFNESWITYSNESKQKNLGVSVHSLKKFGAVSEQVACEMALGALKKSGADWALSLTGIAGPDGAVLGKPVGTVWVGVANKNEVTAKMFSIPGDRDLVRKRASFMAFFFLYRCIQKKYLHK